MSKALTALRRACATGRDAQTVTVRRGHLRELLAEYDRLTRPAVSSEDTAALGCMRCVSEGACSLAESECHHPTWERRVERVGPSDAVESEATGRGGGKEAEP